MVYSQPFNSLPSSGRALTAHVLSKRTASHFRVGWSATCLAHCFLAMAIASAFVKAAACPAAIRHGKTITLSCHRTLGFPFINHLHDVANVPKPGTGAVWVRGVGQFFFRVPSVRSL